ncbi:hypothetical protein CPC08DRAFT_707281 [Agrocybe pediades]|nr:hypothetical protein CPC08DRAFT_707281 [Agrocybe pediades]
MFSLRVAFILASSMVALVASNPLAVERTASNPLGLPTHLTCECNSPSGCPGQCITTSAGIPACNNYCGTGTIIPCGGCATGFNGCIINLDDLSCSTAF